MAIAATASYPLRLRVAAALAVESPLGADEIASRTDEPLHKVRRHLNALVADGIVSVAAEESRRGAMKRYFALEKLIWLEPEDEVFLDPRERRQLHQETLEKVEEILAENRTRLDSGEEAAIGVISSQILLEAPQHGPSSV